MVRKEQFMANPFEHLADPLVHVPTDMAHPVIATAAALAITGGTLYARYQMSRNFEQGAIDFRRNGDALLASQLGTERATDRQRLQPVYVTAAGIGLIAMQLIGQPSYDSLIKNDEAEAVVVLDASSSMIFTNDITGSKESRYGAAVAAVDATKYAGNLGFIETAGSLKTITKPVKNWRNYSKELKNPEVDSNGGQLADALETAASVITEDTATKKRAGTVLIISDGNGVESNKQISDKVDSLKQNGLTVRVIVPGTPKATYRLPKTTKDVDSSIKLDTFTSFGKIESSSSTGDLQKAVAAELKLAENVGAGHKKNRWPIPGYLGAIVLLAGIGQSTRRVISKF